MHLLSAALQILATRTESPEILGALSTLSDFYGENTPVARRRLRTTIERHGLGINEQFLAAAEAIIKVQTKNNSNKTHQRNKSYCYKVGSMHIASSFLYARWICMLGLAREGTLQPQSSNSASTQAMRGMVAPAKSGTRCEPALLQCYVMLLFHAVLQLTLGLPVPQK